MAHGSHFEIIYEEVTDALHDSTILLTGATGFVGTAMLFRLLHDPPFRTSIKRVLALVRADNLEAAIARLPCALQSFAHPDPAQPGTAPKLVVLQGDCSRVKLGLTGEQARIAQEADIVIHAAGDTRFKLSWEDAIEAIADIAYATARFSLTSTQVKTHLHVSTSYVGWYKSPGSTIYERLSQEGSHTSVSDYETHANSYLQAASIAESCVNAIFSPQAGQVIHGKAARIIRLATLGPAAEFPRPGWGVGHPSSPISAGISAKTFDPERQAPWMPRDATVEIVPVDIAVNQILALAAAVHRTHKLPTDAPAHPCSPASPLNRHRTDLLCYTVATGLEPFYQAHMTTINMKETKISNPFIPEGKLLEYYRPFISKTISFDTARTQKVLGITPPMALQPEPSPIWTDPPIDCGSLQIDCPRIVEGLWGALGGPDSVGWIGYLKCIRDEMEANGPSISWDIYVS
ncbi:hypothetical protein GQ53DRAFT_664826 [Thozetella sp. PMI_491]|nr:hypothetical protein GQ53DRAFT_664826 [Thozetella sp. PMI_491]